MKFPTAIVLASAFAIVLAGFGCDDAENSPPVTLGTSGGDSEPRPTGESTGDSESTDESADEPPEQLPELPDGAQIPTESTSEDGESDRSHPAALPEGTSEQHQRLVEGRTAFVSDRYSEATEIFEELAFDEPVTGDTVSAAIALAQIYLETGRPEEALELFGQLEDHVSQFPEVLLVLARTYAELDYPERAIDAYSRAFEQNPRYIFILPEKAQVLHSEGREDEAAETLTLYERRVVEMRAYLENTEQTTKEQRLYVADIFGLLDDQRAHDALENAVADDPSEEVRVRAAEVLGDAGVIQAEQTLRDAATDDFSETVRQTARRSLEQLREFRERYGEDEINE